MISHNVNNFRMYQLTHSRAACRGYPNNFEFTYKVIHKANSCETRTFLLNYENIIRTISDLNNFGDIKKYGLLIT